MPLKQINQPIGFQVTTTSSDRQWNNRPPYEVLTAITAARNLAFARQAASDATWILNPIFEGDIDTPVKEAPTPFDPFHARIKYRSCPAIGFTPEEYDFINGAGFAIIHISEQNPHSINEVEYISDLETSNIAEHINSLFKSSRVWIGDMSVGSLCNPIYLTKANTTAIHRLIDAINGELELDLDYEDYTL